MIDPVPCPLCLHQQTMNARLAGREAIHDDPPLMFWQVPTRGIRAQVCTDHDRGWWECRECYLQLSAHAAGVLLDAALMHAFPNCDSIADGLHADVRRAWLERPTPAKPQPTGGRLIRGDRWPPRPPEP
jgi:hypothetical protein